MLTPLVANVLTPENVQWTGAVNVTVNGNSLTKSTAGAAWDAGANSTKTIVSGDGYVEMTVSEMNKDRFFGLSHAETTVSYSDIDFAVRPYSNGAVYCYEPGTNGAFCGWMSTGQKLRVAVESGVVKYYMINGTTLTLMYTATRTPTYPLAADAAIYDSGGTVTNAVIATSAPSTPPPSITSVSPSSGPTTGGTSVSITGTGFSPGTNVSFGGSPATNVVVVSSTLITASTPVHAAGSVNMAVASPDFPNEVALYMYFYVSPTSSPENVQWTSTLNVTVNSNSITKSTAAAAWDAGANSTKTIVSGDGYVEMTVSEMNKDRFFGLSHAETTVSYSDIDFAVRPYSNGAVYCYEPGTNGAFCGWMSTGQKLRVAVESGVVKYYMINGTTLTLMYTATRTPTYPLAADAAIYDSGGTVTNAVIAGNLSGSPGTSASQQISRLDPLNETGGGGENPLSRNFNWNLPVLSLPGRAGLDLSLMLAYNSLVWTRSGNLISFDSDGGYPAPGFRLGFPAIEPQYFNSEVGKNAFLLLNSDGSRTELRQVGASQLYEAADSSHMLLDASNSNMTLRGTDGTQLTFSFNGARYNCTEIKDRNGNYITIRYNVSGIESITDTPGRTITFTYENGRLANISQVWNQGTAAAVTHYWARFIYNTMTTVQTNFTGITVVGPSNGSKITTLSQVTLADGSHYDFSYTTWGQVWKISSVAPDGHVLNYRSYNVAQTSATVLDDCPRFTERRDWAQYWNGDTDGTTVSTEEAVTGFAVPTSEPPWTMPDGTTVPSWTMPDGTTRAGTSVQVTSPDGTSNKIYFIGVAGKPSSWQRGLPALVNTYDSAGALQRQVMTAWTQDDETKTCILNPRVKETNIYDPAGNRKRTEIKYQSIPLDNGMSCQLPQDVLEYDKDAIAVLRTTRILYVSDSAYLNRRIIGLPKESLLYEGGVSGVNLRSRQEFKYDEGGSIQGTDAPVQHDNTNYTSSFVAGRANLSSLKRYDVNDVTNASFTTTSVKYNTAGAPVSSKDALNHEVTISYADSFSDGNTTRNTLAYPTTVTDPDGFFSTSKYHFDFGAVTSKRTPKPNVTTKTLGPEQTFTFDALGRLERTTNAVNGAYTRLVYAASQIQTDMYATIEDGKGEAHSFQITDGAGRVIATAIDHPGSFGGFSGQKNVYDVLGRVIKTSNPTETRATGAPSQWDTAGDDVSAGWIYTQQSYDWKGRPRVITNQDGTTKTASYDGCGCAGNEIITLTDEGTLDAGVTKKRQQKMFKDVLGRVVKTQVLNWDGTVYSTAVNTYNARNQITLIRQYQGSETSSTFQDTVTTHDGYGRIKTQHSPEMQADPTNSLSSDHITYDYFADDRVQNVTDARGATSSFLNNARGLVYSVHYTAPSGISVPADVTYTYDAAGNRTSMSDGFGRTDYSYDSLSQLTSEARQFTGLSGTYTLSYTYNLSGLLKSITDPTGAAVNYTLSAVGRPLSVTGSAFGGVSTYASNLQYRASGALKHMEYSNGRVMDQTYTSTLRPLHFEIPGIMVKDYQYHPDGRIKYSADLRDNRFDRSYSYDHAGRVKDALSGPAARGLADTTNRPYKETYFYDTLGHITGRAARIWNGFAGPFDAGDYVNNRMTGWKYDGNGKITASANEQFTYDAAGRSITTVSNSGKRTDIRTMDGDGIEVKRVEADSDEGTSTTYNIYSSVLGRNITELNNLGQKTRTFVYLNDEVLATQHRSGSTDFVLWEYRDPSNATYMVVGVPGIPDDVTRGELDPSGADAGTTNPSGVPRSVPREDRTYPGLADLMSGGCFIDGIPAPCGIATMLLRSGAGVEQEPGSSITSGLPQPKKKPAQPAPTLLPNRHGTPSPPVPTRTNTTITIYGGVTKIQESFTDNEGTSEGTIIFDFNELLPTLIQGTGGLTQAQKDTIQDSINAASELLSDSDCLDFVNKVVDRAAHVAYAFHFENDPIEIDGMYPAYSAGVAHNNYATQFDRGNVTASGASGTSGHSVTYGQTNSTTKAVSWNNEFFGTIRSVRGFHTLHESLHQFRNFTDEVLANAARFVRGLAQKDFSTETDPTGAASRDFNNSLETRCNPHLISSSDQ